MDKRIFKVGDRVFDIRYGWGTIISCEITRTYSIQVKFDKYGSDEMYYSKNGKVYPDDKHPTLSFTEYTLQGFSQERPIEYSNHIGKWGKFWNNGDKQYLISKLERLVLSSFRPRTEKKFYDNFEPLTEEQIKILGLCN